MQDIQDPISLKARDMPESEIQGNCLRARQKLFRRRSLSGCTHGPIIQIESGNRLSKLSVIPTFAI